MLILSSESSAEGIALGIGVHLQIHCQSCPIIVLRRPARRPVDYDRKRKLTARGTQKLAWRRFWPPRRTFSKVENSLPEIPVWQLPGVRERWVTIESADVRYVWVYRMDMFARVCQLSRLRSTNKWWYANLSCDIH